MILPALFGPGTQICLKTAPWPIVQFNSAETGVGPSTLVPQRTLSLAKAGRTRKSGSSVKLRMPIRQRRVNVLWVIFSRYRAPRARMLLYFWPSSKYPHHWNRRRYFWTILRSLTRDAGFREVRTHFARMWTDRQSSRRSFKRVSKRESLYLYCLCSSYGSNAAISLRTLGSGNEGRK